MRVPLEAAMLVHLIWSEAFCASVWKSRMRLVMEM